MTVKGQKSEETQITLRNKYQNLPLQQKRNSPFSKIFIHVLLLKHNSWSPGQLLKSSNLQAACVELSDFGLLNDLSRTFSSILQILTQTNVLVLDLMFTDAHNVQLQMLNESPLPTLKDLTTERKCSPSKAFCRVPLISIFSYSFLFLLTLHELVYGYLHSFNFSHLPGQMWELNILVEV